MPRTGLTRMTVNRFNRFGPLVVFLVAAVVYIQSVRFGFAGDDLPGIQDRALFHDMSRWQEILSSSWWPHALYRPLTALSLALNWAIAPGNAGAFHAVNLVLHGVVSVLVYLLARELIAAPAGFVAGLLFALHPVHVEPVVNVVGRAEVLSALFAVAAVLLYRWDGRLAEAGDSRSWRRAVASFGALAATAFALAAKESAFAIPALLLAADWYDSEARRQRLADGLRRHRVLWAGSVAVCLAWLLLRASIVEDLTGLEAAPGLEYHGLPGRTMIMLPIVLQYARLLFFPARLSVEYSPDFVPVTTALTPAAGLGAALVLAALTSAVVIRHRAPVVTLAIAWMAATLFIVSNILVPTGILLAERTLYLPSVGAVLLLAWTWSEMSRRAPLPAAAGLAVVLAAGCLKIVTRTPIWRDNTTYLMAMVHDAPGSFRAEWTEAELARRQGDLRGAESHLRRAVHIHPLGWHVWRNLATLMYLEGRYIEAAHYFSAAWRINGGSAIDAQRAIQANLQAGRIDTAAAFLQDAIAKRPHVPVELTLAASDIALARGDFLEAMTLRRRAAWDFPDSARYWALTAAAAVRASHCPEVLHSLDRLRALPTGGEFVPGLERDARDLRCQ